MRLPEMICHKCAIRNNLVADVEGFPRDIAAEASPQKLQADAVAEAGFEDFEFALPGFDGDVVHLFEEGEFGVCVVVRGDGFDFFEDFLLP